MHMDCGFYTLNQIPFHRHKSWRHEGSWRKVDMVSKYLLGLINDEKVAGKEIRHIDR